ncbi:hypothetical protein LCGC14_3143110 [marine sediment metagenome]|uniref:Uncharacterized protein n=1 Tax=marine sediment metagenome TaxID=412755 RepID=A0A0F8YKL5_9ZZZZ
METKLLQLFKAVKSVKIGGHRVKVKYPYKFSADAGATVVQLGGADRRGTNS